MSNNQEIANFRVLPRNRNASAKSNPQKSGRGFIFPICLSPCQRNIWTYPYGLWKGGGALFRENPRGRRKLVRSRSIFGFFGTFFSAIIRRMRGSFSAHFRPILKSCWGGSLFRSFLVEKYFQILKNRDFEIS